MLLAAQTDPPSAKGFRRWLVSKPLSFWIMTWFLIELVVLTVIGKFFRGPGWSWVWPWGDKLAMERQIQLTLAYFFGDSARAFGTVSIIFVLLLAIAPAKDYFSEWRHYQKQYLRLISNGPMQ